MRSLVFATVQHALSSHVRYLKSAALAASALGISHAALAHEVDLRQAAQSVAGIYSSIYLHEAGHALAAKAFGATDITISVPRQGTFLSGSTTAQFPAPLSSQQRQIFAITGLVTANLAGEIVLQQPGLRESPYMQSVSGTSIVSNLIHVTQYYTRIRGRQGWAGNDIDQFELAGGNPHLFSAALTAYSLWALQRMQKHDVPLFFVSLKF